MAKLPARFNPIALPGVLTLLMTFVVSGITAIRAVGFEPGFLSIWMSAWFISWIVAFPVMVMVMPLAKRIVAVFVMPPPMG